MLRALLLEDSPQDVEIIRELLIDAGFDLDMDCTALEKEFISLLRSRTYDIILADFKLPGFDGFAALRWSTEICPKVPFICVSGIIGEETAVELLKQGAVDYVLKDRLAKLPSAIHRALEEAKEKEARRQTEAALKESKERYNALFERSLDLIYACDFEGNFIDANNPALDLLGYKREDIRSLNFASLLSEDQLPLAFKVIEEIRETGSHKALVEFRLQGKNGKEVFVESKGSAIISNGIAVAIQSIARDITERKRVEKALSQSEERFKLLYEYAPLGIILANRSGQILEVNPAALQILGSPSVEETKKINLLTFPPLIKSGVSAALKSCIETGQAGFGEYSYTSKWEKTINMHLRYVPILDDHNQVTLVHIIMEDITERRRADEAVRESEERFRMVFENIFDGISIYIEDPDPSKRRLVECNNQYAAMAGRTREELLTLGNTLGLQRTITDKAHDKNFESRTPGSGYMGSFSWIRPDGKDNIIEYTGMPIIWRGKLHSISIDRDITERRRAEEESTRLAAIVRSSEDAIIGETMEGIITSWNKGAEKIYGFTETEVVGKSISLLSPLGSEDEAAAILERLRSGKSSEQFETVRRRKDGQEIQMSITISPIWSQEGTIIAASTIGRNISELKKLERNLSAAAEMAKLGYWEYDVASGNFIFSDQYFRLIHASSSEKQGGNSMSAEEFTRRLVYPDDSFLVGEALRQGMESADPNYSGEQEARVYREDGSVATVNVMFKVSKDISGHTNKIYGANQDVTERKRTEEERNRLIIAIEQTAEAIVVTDPRGIIQYVNPAFEQITGHRRAEVIGGNPSILKSGRQNTEFYEKLWKTISLGKKWTGRFINQKKDGTLFTDETSISPVVNEKGEIINYVGVKRDITSELSLESQLFQAQKLESIGTLASGIAHDFNNILGIIMGHASLLDRLREDPHMYTESVAAILNASQRGASLVKQLMLFARKTEALLESVRINRIIEEITKLLKETFPKTITIATSLQQDLPAIIADSSQIHQVLLNLLVNARDAMPGTGMISITTRMVEGNVVRTQFPKAAARHYALVEVADTGTGMDEPTRQRIFEPFFTTKEVGKGTGLGLAVVFGIVHHHNGFIDVRSEPGEGTSFDLYFPIPERAGGEIQAAGKSLADIPGGTETILLIEDEEVLMTLAKGTLVSKGYTVLTAGDGLQGVEMYKSHQKKIAVVLTDIGLPIFSGHEVFRKIRAINPEAKIIFVSGLFDPGTKSEMFKAGLTNFIQKPYLQDEVLRKVREAIDTK